MSTTMTTEMSTPTPKPPKPPKPPTPTPTPTPPLPSPKLPFLKLNLDEPGISRLELLAAFPNVLQVVPPTPATATATTDTTTTDTATADRKIPPAIRCLICQKTLLSKGTAPIIQHLKSVAHGVKRRSAEEDIHPQVAMILNQFPNAFIRIGHTTIQCVVCRAELTGPRPEAKRHLETEQHLRAKAIRAQRDAVDRLSKEHFERLYVQSLFQDAAAMVGRAEALRRALEPLCGRPLPSVVAVRRILTDLERNTDAQGHQVRVTLPEDPMKPLQALKMVDKVLNAEKKKKKWKGTGKAKRSAADMKEEEEDEEDEEDEEGGGEPKAKKAKKSLKKTMEIKIKEEETEESDISKEAYSFSSSASNSASNSATESSSLACYNSGFQANNFGFL